jgi:hypothetical protein
MENDFRYKMEHMGDYFVDMLGKVTCASKSSARGVVLTYDIHQLKSKKETLIRDIGRRVAQISKDNTSFSQDEITTELLARLDETEKRLNAYVQERQCLLNYRCKSHTSETTTNDAPQGV